MEIPDYFTDSNYFFLISLIFEGDTKCTEWDICPEATKRANEYHEIMEKQADVLVTDSFANPLGAL